MTETALTFDEAGYAMFLRRALEKGYSVGPVCEGLEAESPHLILRHDVDYSLDRAVAMAEIEHREGVRSSYFIMLASAFYNALAPRSRMLLRRLVELGHEVGLHWDSSGYPGDEAGASRHFRREAELLGDAAGVTIRSASQHIPTDNPAFDLEAYIDFEAYSKRFMNRYRYVSDSCMLWRGESVLELLDTGGDLYFLAHPLWWTARGKLQNAKLQSTVAELQARLSDEMADYMDYMQVLIAGREELDRKFKERRGWTAEGTDSA